jgi:two-component system phosphate regulon sensor histidine kinase PhoR
MMYLGWVIMLALAGAAGWLLERARRERHSLIRFAQRVVTEPEMPNPSAWPRGKRGPGVVAIDRMTEVLQQRLAEARSAAGRLEAVLGGMVEGVLVVDDEGVVIFSNRRIQELLELPPDEDCIGRPLIELTRHPDVHDLVRRVMHEIDPDQALVQEMTLDGSRHQMLQVTATPLGDEGKLPQAFILVFHDISELKHLERIRRDFVANVSHELRTPLAAIRGYSETLLTGALEDPESTKRFLGIIERHAERLGRLVDDLLTLSDLELGRTELQRTAVEAEELVERVFEVLHEKAVRGRISLERDIAPHTPALDADPDRLEQALLNLVDNAIKYTPEGGRVTVRGRPIRSDGAGARLVDLAVGDTGLGVPPADLPRLTERFYRVDKARSRQMGGTGLGLAIVKHIVQAHGGSIRIESELNKGTIVHLLWPAHATPATRAVDARVRRTGT